MALNINGTTGISGVDGSASAPAVTGTDSNTGINFASDTVNINTGGITRAKVDSAGNLGLGTSSPTAASGETTLNIFANEYPELHLTSSVTGTAATDGSIFTLNNDNSTVIRNQENSYIRFDTNGSNERMRIDSSGNVLVGTTSTTINTSNFGIGAFANNNFSVSANVTGASTVVRMGGNQGLVKVQGDGDLFNTNNTYGQVSDETLKQDIVDAGSQWNDIKNLRVRKFRFKDNPTGVLQIGVVAQETEKVSAGLVQEDDEGIKSVKYSVLYMKAIKALQEAQARIETLETKVAALEAA